MKGEDFSQVYSRLKVVVCNLKEPGIAQLIFLILQILAMRSKLYVLV